MKKIVDTLINESVKGVDTYTHNGSTWLIFTDTKQWVIELTESKTLWYNYNLFKGMFAYASMDVVENQHYITQWVEDNIINGVKHTNSFDNPSLVDVGYTIKNGVKETSHNVMLFQSMKVEDTIQNGIIEKSVTENSLSFVKMKIDCENVIENGVKETELHGGIRPSAVEDTLQNGIKETGINLYQEKDVRDVIQNGVKETMFNQGHKPLTVKNIIENGIKETRLEMNITEGEVDDIIQDGVRDISPMTQYTDWQVEEIIENGVKNIRGIENDRSFFIEDTLEMGVKETNHIKNNVRETKHFEEHLADTIDGVINEGVKSTGRIHKDYTKVVEYLIENGVKETKFHISNMRIKAHKAVDKGVKEIYDYKGHRWDVKNVIQDGVKETKTPGNCDIASTAEWMKENNSTSYPKMIDDVIENGVKEIRPSGCVDKKTGIFYYRIQEEVDDVVDNGVKEIKTPNKDGDIKSTLEWMYKNNYQDDYNGSKMINNVIENGVKETSPCEYLNPNTGNFHGKLGLGIREVIENGIKETHNLVGEQQLMVDDTIQNGIKEINPLPAQDGNKDWGNYYYRKGDPTKPFIDYLEETIKFGVKENLS